MTPPTVTHILINYGGNFVFGTTIAKRLAGQFTLNAYYTDNSLTTIPNSSVTWSSSDPSKMTVDASGNFAGVAAGTATITATFSGASNSATFTLRDPVVAPAITVTCNPASPMNLRYSTWNNNYATDPTNATEWAVVDPVTCTTYLNIVLVTGVSSGSIILRATQISPTVYGPAITYASGSSPQLSVGDALNIGYPTSSIMYNKIYSITAN